MAIGLAQAVVDSGSVTGATQTATYGANVTAGNTLVALVGYSAVTGTVQVSDNLNGATNFWTQQSLRQGHARTIGVYTFKGTLGGAKPIVTATVSASQTQLQVIIFELTGLCNVDALLANDAAAATSVSIGPITTTGTADFLLSFLMGGTPTAGTAGWTYTVTSISNRAYEYIASQPAGSYTATYTQASASWNAVIMAFIQAGVVQQASVSIGAKAAVSATGASILPVVGTNSIAVGSSSLAVDVQGIPPTVIRTHASLSAIVRMIYGGPVAIGAQASITPGATDIASAKAILGPRATVSPWSTNPLSAVASIAAKATIIATGKRNLLASSTIQAKAAVIASSRVLRRGVGSISGGAFISATETSNAVLVVGSSRFAVGSSGFAVDASPVGAIVRIGAKATILASVKNLTSVNNLIGTGASILATPSSLFRPSVAIAAKISISAVASVSRAAGTTIGTKASVALTAKILKRATAVITGSVSLLGATNTSAILVVGSSRYAVGQVGIAVDESPSSAIIFLTALGSIFAKSRVLHHNLSYQITGQASVLAIGGDVMTVSDAITAKAALTVLSRRLQNISTSIHPGISITALGGTAGNANSATILAGITLFSSSKVLRRPKNFLIGSGTQVGASASVIRGQVGCAIGCGANVSATPNPSTTGYVVVGSSRYPVGSSAFAVNEGAIGSYLAIHSHATIFASAVTKGAQSVTINAYGTISALATINSPVSVNIQASGKFAQAKAKIFAKAIGFLIGAGASVTASSLKGGVAICSVTAKATLSVTAKVMKRGAVTISAQASTTPSSGVKVSAKTTISRGATLTALSIIHGFAPATNIQSGARILTSVKILRRATDTVAARATISANVSQAKALNVSIGSKASLSVRGLKTTILASLWGTASIRGQGRVLRSVTDNITCWGNLWLIPRVLRNATANLSGKLSMWDYLAVRYSVSDSIHSGSSVTARELILRQVKVLISTKASVSASILRGAGIKAAIFPKASLNLPAGVLHRGNMSIFGYASLTPTGILRKGIHATIQSEAFVNVWGLVLRRAFVPVSARATLSVTASVIRKAAVVVAGKASLTASSRVIHKAQTSISIGSSVHAFGRREVKISSTINTSIHVSPTGLRVFMGGVSGTVTSLYPTSKVSLMQAVVSILPGYDLPPGSPPTDNMAGVQATITSLYPTSDVSIVDPTSNISVIPS